MMQKELNLFSAYKSSGSKGAKGGKSAKGILILSGCFLLVVLLIYGGLLFFKINMQNQINSIKNELLTPAVKEANLRISYEIKKNEMLISYINALNTAKTKFDASLIIDSQLLNKITSSMPDDVIMTDINISPVSIQISCNSSNVLAPDIFIQALNSKDLFSNVSYNGLKNNVERNLFTFVLECDFKEVTPQ